MADFDFGEIEARHERARAAMARSGVDALLATSESNYRWLGGHASQAWVIKARPLMAVLPVRGDPFLIVPGSEVSGARLTSWIREVRSFGTLREPGVNELVDALRDRGLAGGVIGCEFGPGHRLGLALSDFDVLRARIPDARFVDASAILWALRSIKSPAEIAYLRRAATITSDATDAAIAAARLGWSERDIYHALARAIIAAGADRLGYMPVNADTHAPDSTTGGPTDRRTRTGGMVYMGAGCVVRGYWSDAVRCFAAGRASDSQRAVYRTIREALRRCLPRIVPGVPVADIVRISLATFEEGGLLAGVNRGGRIGHGTGLDLSEPPSIALDDGAVLEVGNVIYFEPNCQTEDGNFMVEETFVVTPDGCERLGGAAADELPVIA